MSQSIPLERISSLDYPRRTEIDDPRTFRTSSKNDQPGSTVGTVTLLDANVYATKKTIAQGMLDVALLTANASQLKYLLQLGKEQQFFYLMVTLISLSIILQVILGGIFVILGMLNLNDPQKHRMVNFINNITLAVVFIITIVNVLIAGFGR